MRPTLVLVVTLLTALLACRSPEAGAEFNGTALNDDAPAPGFTLTDQLGRPASLDDMRGSVVALTFLFTNCPDVCPIVMNQLRHARDGLGADADSVRFVVVSVDPERDDVDAAARYLSKWEVDYRWSFLVGDRASLEPVWRSYYVDPVIDDPETAKLVSAKREGAIDALGAEIANDFLVLHSAPVYLIDRDGNRRVVFTPPLDPEEVIADIRKMLR